MSSYSIHKNGVSQLATSRMHGASDLNMRVAPYRPHCVPPHINLPAIPPLPSLDPEMPHRFLMRLGLPREKVKLILNDIMRYATLFKQRSEAKLLAAWLNLARMPYAHDDTTPLEEILGDAYVLHRREYLVGLTNWIWATLVDKYGLSGLQEGKPTVKVESTIATTEIRRLPSSSRKAISIRCRITTRGGKRRRDIRGFSADTWGSQKSSAVDR